MKKRIFALLLALALALTLFACTAPAAQNSDTGAASTDTGAATNTGAADPAPTETAVIEADLSQNIVTFAAGAEALAQPLVTVNGVPVSNALTIYWLAYNCSYFESYYSMYGLTVADFADMLLNDSVSIAAYNALLQQKATENGCPLTDEQMEAVLADMKVDSDDYQQRLNLYGFTHEDLLFVYSMEDLYDNLMATMIPTPTEDDLNNYVYQVKHILISTVDTKGEGSYDDNGNYVYPSLDEKTVAEKTKLANDILAQLQACETPEELNTLFDELMNEHSEDGRKEDGTLYSPEGYTAVPGDMVAAFEEASLALEIGGLSGLVESEFGYHIILRGTVEDLDSYTDEYSAAQMDALMEQWLEEAEIAESEALKTLDVAQIYARYLVWQDAYAATLPTEDK